MFTFLKNAIEKDPHVLPTAKAAIEMLMRICPNILLPSPDVYVGEDYEILMSWDNNEHHFEIEFRDPRYAEFFYYDHTTNNVWEYSQLVACTTPRWDLYWMRTCLIKSAKW